MRIGYISRVLPVLSETFVISEIRALEEHGHEIIPFSVHRPEEGSFQENARDVFEKVTVVNNPSSAGFWFANITQCFANPLRYFSTFFRYVIKPKLSLKNRLRAFSQFLLSAEAARQFKKAKLEIIHAHFAHIAAGVSMMGARIAGIPFSFTIHAYGLFGDNMLLPEKLRDAAFVSTVSEYNIDYIRQHYPETANRPANLVRCTIDPERFTPSGRKPAPQPTVVAVGRLVPMKCFDVLIEACDIVRREFPEMACNIIGDGPMRKELDEKITRLGLQGVVNLKGKMMQEEVRDELNSAWVFALPSCIRETSDNLPVALMESLAMEIPTVSTRVRAIPELIIDEHTGLLIEPDNREQLAAAISKLFRNPPLAEQLGRNGRELVLKEFTSGLNSERLERLFLDALGKA